METPAFTHHPKIFALGTRQTSDIFDGQNDLIIEEKVDGSQFAFGRLGGHVRARSKGQEIHLPHSDGMFGPGCQHVERIAERLVAEDRQETALDLVALLLHEVALDLRVVERVVLGLLEILAVEDEPLRESLGDPLRTALRGFPEWYKAQLAATVLA